MFFLPLAEGAPDDGAGTPDDPVFFIGHEEVALNPDEVFMLPVFVFVGECYDKRLPDDEPLPAEVFTGADVLITLDGRTLINSEKHDLNWYYADTVFFDEIILYDEPQPRGPGVNAIGALWVQGLGFLHGPLEEGEQHAHAVRRYRLRFRV